MIGKHENRRAVLFEGGPWHGRTEYVQVPHPRVLLVPNMPRLRWWQVWVADTEPIRPPARYALDEDGVYRVRWNITKEEST